MRRATGIDGCPAGWIAVWRDGAGVWRDLADLLADTEAAILGLDMPIGLADSGPRVCDQLARQRLGRPRATSVFPPPARVALAATTHAQASERNAAACGRRLSAQSFNLFPKLRQVDGLAPAPMPASA